jgi:uncharacterized YigZ family protein
MNQTYFTITSEARSEFSDRGSKFLGYAFPIGSVEEGKMKLQGVRKEHPKASHHCFAWRIGQLAEIHRVSDDGEPSGSAGRPILNQLQSLELTNVMVVVVRYFGGTMLGIPGLINAYKTAAADALSKAGRWEKNIEVNFEVTCDYTVMNEVLQVFRQYHVTILEREQMLFCRFVAGVPIASRENFVKRISDIRGVEVKQEGPRS